MRKQYLAHQHALGLRQSVETGAIINERLEMRDIRGAFFLAWNAGDRWIYPEFITEVFDNVPYLTEEIAQEFIDFCQQIAFSDSGVLKFEAQRQNFSMGVLEIQRDQL